MYWEKKAICQDNFMDIYYLTSKFTEYIKGLRIKNIDFEYIPVLNSNRISGFLGFIFCLNSLLYLYKTLILPEKLDFIRTYKLSQDYLELFFRSVRS